MVEFFNKMFTAGTGVSSMRWVFVLTWCWIVVAPLWGWLQKYLLDSTADIPGNVLAFCLGIGAIITGGKVGQTVVEKRGKAMLANPKNWLIIGLVAISVMIYIWLGAERLVVAKQKTTIKEQEGVISALKIDVATRDSVINSMRKSLTAARKVISDMQNVEDQSSQIRQDLEDIPASDVEKGGKIGEEYSRVADDITDKFNNSRVRAKITADRADATDVLPGAGKADDRKASTWTVSKLLEAYLEVVDYAIKLEKTVDCYEERLQEK